MSTLFTSIRLRPDTLSSMLVAGALVICSAFSMQASSPAPEGYFLQVQTVATHTSGELEGMTTYRVYLKCLNATDYLSSCSGDINNPMEITTSSGSWWNSPYNPSWNASGLNPAVMGFFPELAYDSFLTIGAADGSVPAGEHPNSVWGDNDVSLEFVPGGGNNVVLDDEIGGAWYTPFPGAAAAETHSAFAGEDLEILVMQITTAGDLTGQTHLQVFMNADQNQEWRDLLVFEQAVPGCMDVAACNYDPFATATDDSCTYALEFQDCEGVCFNDFDGDGICDEQDTMVLGCTVVTACNFQPLATNNDGSCEFPAEGLDCEGVCLADLDGDGVCDANEVPGCTDETACNFDASATDDGGNCTYPEAGYDCDGVCYDDDMDGICNVEEIPGCTDDLACNYDASATDDGGNCTYPETGFDCDGVCYDDDMDGICNVDEIPGCMDAAACNYNADATDAAGDCTFAEEGYDCDGVCIDTDADGVCDLDEIAGCQDALACNYDASATDDSGDCTFADEGYDCDGNCLNDADGDNVCDEFEVAGCMDDLACNYDALATDEDGSCEYAEEAYLDCDGNCLNDADGDGICDEMEVEGCTSMDACNYDALATDDNDSCEYPGDSCDDGDDTTVNDTLDDSCNCVGETEVDGLGDTPAMAWDVALYPNPAMHDLNIQVSNPGTVDGTVEMINLAGQILRTDRLARTTTIDVRDLPAGVYLVRMNGAWGTTTRRVLVGSAH